MWIDKLAAFRASFAETLAITIMMQYQIVLRHTLPRLERLPAKTAPEALGVPIVTSKIQL